MKKTLSFLTALLFLGGCNDDNATTHLYTKEKPDIKCLRLVVFPPDKLIEKTLKNLYNFSKNCDYEFRASKKSGIKCNSNQNAPKKALSNFPTGYLRFDVYKNNHIIYSYYKDLDSKVKKEDIKNGFAQLKKDLL
jgi:hypothetical protein